MTEVEWTAVFDPAARQLLLPPVEHCIIRHASSPLVEDRVATPTGDIPASMFVEVQVPSVPTELKVLEIELDADLWLGLPAGSHDIEVRVHSPGSSAWFAISGGKARSLTAVDTFV